ncbi:hypothetical protein SPF06_07915 [Sinomonas sp. JGH33]|uniref:Uncharacterized protein n=1 Tax=Sinomonas terricola TaxID=3110330 RepID=A0ABU5T4Q2_9MICC|nr:hypothetical protein [Sinomonas sp. JGH33]MEA5454642.1 hypothetical protein [Sinomonas sp. JGH33]
MGKAARLKRSRTYKGPDGSDRFIPGFTTRRAEALRGHCAEAVRALGYRAWDRGSHIVVTGGPFTAPGAILGFSTISREAARVPEDQWGPLAAEVIGRLIASALAAPPHLDRTQLREGLFPRFSAPGRIPEELLAEDYTYARRVAGMPLLVAVRHDQASAFLADIHLAKAGGVEEAWSAAEANLVAAGLGDPAIYAAPNGSSVIVFESEHPRQAAWLAYPERLVETLGLDVGPLGALFCVPAHRLLGIQPVREDTTSKEVERMLQLAGILGEGEVAPLSRELFWWRPGEEVLTAQAAGLDQERLGLPPDVGEALKAAGSVGTRGVNPIFDTMDG